MNFIKLIATCMDIYNVKPRYIVLPKYIYNDLVIFFEPNDLMIFIWQYIHSYFLLQGWSYLESCTANQNYMFYILKRRKYFSLEINKEEMMQRIAALCFTWRRMVLRGPNNPLNLIKLVCDATLACRYAEGEEIMHIDFVKI